MLACNSVCKSFILDNKDNKSFRNSFESIYLLLGRISSYKRNLQKRRNSLEF